jgi:transcriptional regulator with XRE-family HTH domain
VVPRDPVDRWRDLGSFIREQRAGARLSLRRLSELAGISNPYLSQIERGLRRPSADILQQIARALRISAETLYVQAGILDPPGDDADLVTAIRADPYLGESQKQALVQIYLSFRREHEREHGHDNAHHEQHEHGHGRRDHEHEREREDATHARGTSGAAAAPHAPSRATQGGSAGGAN